MDPGLTAAIATGAASYVGYGLNFPPGQQNGGDRRIVALALVNIAA